MEQLDFFSETEFMNDEEAQKYEAMKYTANNIYKSSGHRKLIDDALKSFDTNQAYKEFHEAFRTYGFAMGKYSFNGFFGRITIDYELEFEVGSRELFDILLNSIGY